MKKGYLMKARRYFGASIVSILSVVYGLLVMQVFSQQGPPPPQSPLCGQVDTFSSWDCQDMPAWYENLAACRDFICDGDNPVCSTWLAREGGGLIAIGGGLWSEADVDFPPGIGDELEAVWKDCGSVVICASECEATADYGFICKKSPWSPSIPMGGFHYTTKGPCPAIPPVNPPGVQIADL